MNTNLEKLQVWFVTGSQKLYGKETLLKVAEHSQQISSALNNALDAPIELIFKPVLTTPEAIQNLCLEANSSPQCIGLIAWMHTFSPAKMWIAGLNALQKPFVHLHTQFNRDIPWGDIDMDFMNLNQSAHGGREFGFLGTRMRLTRKVIVGYWQDKGVQEKLDCWVRAAIGRHEMQHLKVARFGDNMREVAVTEGDKVAAQMKFGYSVNGYGVGDLVDAVNAVSESETKKLCADYLEQYQISSKDTKDAAYHSTLIEAAQIELGMRAFLEAGEFGAFTTTFEDLHGLPQLPGLAVQRLMADGYGFGAEGDWKTAALVRTMKVMADGLTGGASFMEDYTYHFDPAGSKVLGAHMLEVCPSIAAHKAKLEVHPLGIGGKADPARLVFSTGSGPGLNASLIDMGNRFRMLVNKVQVIAPDADLPKLPVARVVWKPLPDLETAAAAWILAGGAHHTGFSMALTTEHIIDLCDMLDIECLLIDENAKISDLKNQMRWNEVYYHLNNGFIN